MFTERVLPFVKLLRRLGVLPVDVYKFANCIYMYLMIIETVFSYDKYICVPCEYSCLKKSAGRSVESL